VVVKRTRILAYNLAEMIRLELTQTTPLTQETDGTVRISSSRVTFDTVIGAFQKGATAEQIYDSLPSLSLAQIYGAIAYYLEHEADVETYLRERREDAEWIKAAIEKQQDADGFRARIRARRAQLLRS
jgi:uncharacterized protein (DUF433 family)